jgi:hypothetical protein
VHAIEAHVPGDHAHGKRVWGWLHKDKHAAAGQESSSAIQENLDKQADYIIGYPDLGKDEAARTQRLVGMSRMHQVQTLGTLPPLGGNEHAESVKNAQEVLCPILVVPLPPFTCSCCVALMNVEFGLSLAGCEGRQRFHQPGSWRRANFQSARVSEPFGMHRVRILLCAITRVGRNLAG